MKNKGIKEKERRKTKSTECHFKRWIVAIELILFVNLQILKKRKSKQKQNQRQSKGSNDIDSELSLSHSTL